MTTLKQLLDEPRGWQPIETIPENKFVLLCGENGNISHSEILLYLYPHISQELLDGVTHWQPLPAQTNPDNKEKIIQGLLGIIKQKDEFLVRIHDKIATSRQMFNANNIISDVWLNASVTENYARQALTITPENTEVEDEQ